MAAQSPSGSPAIFSYSLFRRVSYYFDKARFTATILGPIVSTIFDVPFPDHETKYTGRSQYEYEREPIQGVRGYYAKYSQYYDSELDTTIQVFLATEQGCRLQEDSESIGATRACSPLILSLQGNGEHRLKSNQNHEKNEKNAMPDDLADHTHLGLDLERAGAPDPRSAKCDFPTQSPNAEPYNVPISEALPIRNRAQLSYLPGQPVDVPVSGVSALKSGLTDRISLCLNVLGPTFELTSCQSFPKILPACALTSKGHFHARYWPHLLPLDPGGDTLLADNQWLPRARCHYPKALLERPLSRPQPFAKFIWMGFSGSTLHSWVWTQSLPCRRSVLACPAPVIWSQGYRVYASSTHGPGPPSGQECFSFDPSGHSRGGLNPGVNNKSGHFNDFQNSSVLNSEAPFGVRYRQLAIEASKLGFRLSLDPIQPTDAGEAFFGQPAFPIPSPVPLSSSIQHDSVHSILTMRSNMTPEVTNTFPLPSPDPGYLNQFVDAPLDTPPTESNFFPNWATQPAPFTPPASQAISPFSEPTGDPQPSVTADTSPRQSNSAPAQQANEPISNKDIDMVMIPSRPTTPNTTNSAGPASGVPCGHSGRRASNKTCLVCGKTFTRKYELDDHMFYHNGRKRHSCPNCRKRFRTRANMTRHRNEVACAQV